MRLIIAFVFSCLLVSTASLASAAPPVTPSPAPAATSAIDIAKARVDQMLRTGHADPAWFSVSFLAQVPATKVDEIIGNFETILGKYQSVEFTPTRFIAHFEKGTDDVLIHLDGDNKIDGLFFRTPAIKTSSLDGALRALQPSEGTLSYVVTVEGRSDRAALNASASLAVGSAFKLAVLNALRDDIKRGSLRWSDVVPLRERWKSLPSGVLRSWPAGTPITLATYAGEMISISDNTAADAMASITGNGALKRYAAGNDPYLTTREMFVLKSAEADDLRKAYLAAGTSTSRARILARVDALPLPAIDQLLSAPELEIEWHYSVKDLCKMIEGVADLPLMSINPGVADPSLFRHVAFKGGSDTGAINLTTAVTTKRGSKICFSATLNNSSRAVNESAFETAYGAVLRYIAGL